MLGITAKYGLRVLVYLTWEPPGEYALGRDLTERTDIPGNYLQKILLALRKAGLVEAARGQGGGYRLARPATAIRLIEVVEVFEGVRSRPSCLLGIHSDCSDDNPCSAHKSFRLMRRAYIDFLERTTIAEVADQEQGAPETIDEAVAR